jgi:hypothetical protein
LLFRSRWRDHRIVSPRPRIARRPSRRRLFGSAIGVVFYRGPERRDLLIPVGQRARECFGVIPRVLGRELEQINQLEKPNQLGKLVGAEQLEEGGLGGELLGCLGLPAGAKLVDESVANRTIDEGRAPSADYAISR